MRLLGPVRLTGTDGDVRLGNRERVVLAVLALGGGEPVELQTLVDAVWGERPPAAARNSLQVAVTRLRQALPVALGGGAAVEWSGSGYALRLPPSSVDALDFRQAVQEVRAAQRLGSSAEAGRAADAALELWPRGPALADVRDSLSVAQLAYELEELRRLTVIPAAVQGALAEGRNAEVIDLLRREGGDAEDDAVTGWLALALYRSGHEEEALSVLRAYRRRLADDGLDVRPGLLDLERDILNHAPALERTATDGPSGRLRPLPPPQEVLGRDEVVADLLRQLQDPRPGVVTITGLGGLGKTTVAMAVAQQWARGDGTGPGDVVFVELASLPAGSTVLRSLAEAAGGDADADDAVSSLRPLAARGRLLVLLDNAEHVLDGVRECANALQRLPGTRILVTSREPLRLPAEREARLGPLAVWRGHREEVLSPAVELFLTRASRAGRRLGSADSDVAARICERLAGLPLAVELAAAQTAALSPTALLTELEEDLLGWLRAGSGAQGGLEAAFGWSHQRLSAAEARVLAVLTCFPESFTAAEAKAVVQAVVGPDDPVHGSVLALLVALVQASWLTSDDGDQETRLRLLVPVREFVQPYCDTIDGARANAAHAGVYADLADTWRADLLAASDAAPVELRQRWRRETVNVVASARWAEQRGGSEILARLLSGLLYLSRRFGGVDRTHWAALALATVGDSTPAVLWEEVGEALFGTRPAEAAQSMERAVARYSSDADAFGHARCVAALSYLYGRLGQTHRGRVLLDGLVESDAWHHLQDAARLRVLNTKAILVEYSGQDDETLVAWLAYRDESRRAASGSHLLIAEASLALFYASVTRLPEARAALSRAEELKVRQGLHHDLGYVHAFVAIAHEDLAEARFAALPALEAVLEPGAGGVVMDELAAVVGTAAVACADLAVPEVRDLAAYALALADASGATRGADWRALLPVLQGLAAPGLCEHSAARLAADREDFLRVVADASSALISAVGSTVSAR